MKTSFYFAGFLLLGTVSVLAQDHQVQGTNVDSIKWGPAPNVLPKGAEMAVLSGDPSKSGEFTIRLRMPPNYMIPAHQHPSYEAVTVISGDLRFGMGDKLEKEKSQALGVGGFVNLPANMNHFAYSPNGVIVQINSEGPFAIKYVDQADDPSQF